jgi:hypothetical protein
MLTDTVTTRRSRRSRVRSGLLAGLASTALVSGLLLTGSVIASNSTLNNFEIEGDLQAGVFPGSSDPTAPGEDWVNTANTGADSAFSALKCTAQPCGTAVTNAIGLVTNVVDGSGLGTGELFRDGLKVDPDPTTFTQGDKENDFSTITTGAGGNLVSQTPWHIVTGTVPPNKDDLFDVATNTYISGSNDELDLGMLRTNNLGSSHVDFELNRLSAAPCAFDATKSCPQRTEGDLLVSFEISPGSITERLFVWDLPGGTNGGGHGFGTDVNCTGPLSGNEHPCPWEEIAPPLDTNGVPNIRTAVNTNSLPAQPWGNRDPSGAATTTIPVGGWFEAALDLDQLGFPPSCPGFGQASAKSRASGSSVTSALTDIAGPFPINLNTCAKIHIVKDTVPNALQDFSYTTTADSPAPALSPASFILDDDAGVTGGDNTRLTTQDYLQVTPGTYHVTEGTVNGYALTSLTCTASTGSSGAQDGTDPNKANIVVGNLGEVTCTYVNSLQRSLVIKKTAKDKAATGGTKLLGGAGFTITPNPLTGTGSATVDDNDAVGGTGKLVDQYNTAGLFCIDQVGAGPFSIDETTVPTNYKGAAIQATVSPSSGTCATRSSGVTLDKTFPADATFVNTPLSKITVDFDSLVPGATTATIQCTGDASEQNLPDGTPRVLGDGTSTLEPGTYTCTVVVDP